MGLDPNDIRLSIEAQVTAPGAEQAAQQIRGAGQAADATRESFTRLRQAGQVGPGPQTVAAPPVNSGGNDRAAQVANDLVRQLVQQRQATEEVFRNAVETVRASTGRTPTITAQELGIAPPPQEAAQNGGAGGGGRGRGGGGNGTFGDAGDGARRVRQDVEALDEPLQRAQRGAGGMASLFNLSSQSLTRASLALVGVGAGLNALVTIANRVHNEIVAAVDAQVELAERSRQLAAEYGPQGGAQLAAGAAAFTANPQTRGNEQDYLAAANALHGLSAEYGLNNEQISTLIDKAGTLARIHNTELAPAVQALQGVLRGNVDAAQQYGIALTDEYGRIRGVGSTYDQLVGTLGKARAEQILYAQVLQQTAQQQQNAAGPADSTANALDRIQKASNNAREALAHLSEKPFNVAVNFLANLVSGFNQQEGPTPAQQAAEQRHPVGQQPGTGIEAQAQRTPGAPLPGASPQPRGQLDFTSSIGAVPPIDAATRAQMGLAAATKDAAAAVTGELSAVERLGQEFQGSLLPTIQRLSTAQQTISNIGTIGQALQGPDQLTGGDIRGRAAAQAAQDVVGQQRQREAQQASALVQQASQFDPNEFARRQAAHQAELEAQQAQTFAGRAQAGAQAQVQTIDLADQQRQLDAAGELASLRTETLSREGNIVDLQRQEADLGDQLRVVNRENLDLLQQQTQARLDSLGAANRLNDLQYGDRRTQLQIQATRADVRRGVLDPSALEQIPDLRQQLRQTRLAEPRAELQALEGGRPAELAARAQQQDELQRGLRAIPVERAQRGVEDRLTPEQQAQRATDERTQGLNRQLELARLAEEPQRTAAERNVLAATAVALAADQSVRSAQEWAAGIHDGLTDLERAWGLLGNLPSGPNSPGSAYPNPTPDRQPGATGGGDSYSVTVHVESSSSPEQIGAAVLNALTRRANRSPSATPRTLAGAR